jgi:hypothetical protein
MSRARESLTIVVRRGSRADRSRSETSVRWIPAACARSSWEKPFLTRHVFRLRANRVTGSTGLMLFARRQFVYRQNITDSLQTLV